MTDVPTRWRTTFEEQVANAELRLTRAEGYLHDDDGSRAMQEAYPAVVAGATVRVWLTEPPWEQSLDAVEMQRRVRETFPGLFAALSEQDIQQVLTSPWRTSDAEPYITEAREFLQETKEQLEQWLAQD